MCKCIAKTEDELWKMHDLIKRKSLAKENKDKIQLTFGTSIVKKK